MSSDLVSIISNIVQDYEEKNSPIVIESVSHKHTIYRINNNKYKWANDYKTCFLTKKGLLMYYEQWFFELEEEDNEIELECGNYRKIVRDVEKCLDKLKWFLEFQAECYE